MQGQKAHLFEISPRGIFLEYKVHFVFYFKPFQDPHYYRIKTRLFNTGCPAIRDTDLFTPLGLLDPSLTSILSSSSPLRVLEAPGTCPAVFSGKPFSSSLAQHTSLAFKTQLKCYLLQETLLYSVNLYWVPRLVWGLIPKFPKYTICNTLYFNYLLTYCTYPAPPQPCTHTQHTCTQPRLSSLRASTMPTREME